MRKRALVVAAAASSLTVLVLGVSHAFTESSGGAARDARFGFPTVTPAPGTKTTRHAQAVIDGQEWSILTYRNAAGELCAAHVVPGEGRGIECASEAELFARGPVTVVLGSRQREGGNLTQWDNAWVWGFAAPSVRSIELVLTNCATSPIRIDDGVYMKVLGGSLLHSRVWPHRLVARDANGQVVADEQLPLGPPPTPEARRAGVTPPRPPRDC